MHMLAFGVVSDEYALTKTSGSNSARGVGNLLNDSLRGNIIVDFPSCASVYAQRKPGIQSDF